MNWKMFKVGAAQSLCGREFHAAGPACEKARSPNLVDSRGARIVCGFGRTQSGTRCLCGCSVDLFAQIGWRMSISLLICFVLTINNHCIFLCY